MLIFCGKNVLRRIQVKLPYHHFIVQLKNINIFLVQYGSRKKRGGGGFRKEGILFSGRVAVMDLRTCPVRNMD